MRALSVLSVVFLLVQSCTSSGNTGAGDTDRDKTESSSSSSDSGQSRTDTCAQFNDITADLTLSDDESAAQYETLADDTADSDLANELRSIAAALRRHDPEVSIAGVLALCDRS
jgi:hypothetical protein